eukprot:3788088-Rhodomonas_salina.1
MTIKRNDDQTECQSNGIRHMREGGNFGRSFGSNRCVSSSVSLPRCTSSQALSLLLRKREFVYVLTEDYLPDDLATARKAKRGTTSLEFRESKQEKLDKADLTASHAGAKRSLTQLYSPPSAAGSSSLFTIRWHPKEGPSWRQP